MITAIFSDTAVEINWLMDTLSRRAFAGQCMEIATRTNSRKKLVKGWRLKGDIAFARRQWEEAGHWLRQALALARDVGNPPQLWKAHLALRRLHTETGRQQQVQQSYQTACQVIDRVKTNLQNPELRTRLKRSPLIQHVYDLNS